MSRSAVAATVFRGRVREQRQRQVSSEAGSESSGSDTWQRQEIRTGTATGAAVRVCEGDMVTPGSFLQFGLIAGEASGVKGRPALGRSPGDP
jgi:hypothetical protein